MLAGMCSDPVEPLAARGLLNEELAASSDEELDEAIDELRTAILRERIDGVTARRRERPPISAESEEDNSRRDGVLHFVIFADIAGRVSKNVLGSPRATSAAVVIPAGQVAGLRKRAALLPKWGRCLLQHAKEALVLMTQEATTVYCVSLDKTTDQWAAAVADGELLHRKIAEESGPGSGWAKPSVLLTIELLCRACFGAVALTLGRWRDANPGATGVQAFEFSIICDTELGGAETIALFKSFWNEEHVPAEKLEMLGYSVDHRSVELKSEQDEPLLMLADYAAGLSHSAHIPTPGRLRMPIDHAHSRALLRALEVAGKLFVEVEGVSISYQRIFGRAMDEARARNSDRDIG